MKFKQVKELSDNIEYPHLLSPLDVVWSREGDTIYWIEDEGCYSAYLTEGFEIKEDYFICNGDIQMGYWMTFLFPLEKEISYEEFEDKYQEFM